MAHFHPTFRFLWSGFLLLCPFSASADTALFPGPVIPQPDVTGLYRAGAHVISASIESARQVLPPELELAPQDVSEPGTHPLVFMFGFQKDVRHVLFGWPATIPFLEPADYTEFVFAVPFVQLKPQFRKSGAYHGPFYYMPRLFLDASLPIALGYLYGFHKQRRQISADRHDFEILNSDGHAPMLRAHFSDPSAPFASASDVPAFRSLQKLLSLPVIGKLSIGYYLCSRFTWNDGEEGKAGLQVAPAASTLEVLTPFFPGAQALSSSSSGLGHETLGSFRMISNWRLRGPFGCDSL